MSAEIQELTTQLHLDAISGQPRLHGLGIAKNSCRCIKQRQFTVYGRSQNRESAFFLKQGPLTIGKNFEFTTITHSKGSENCLLITFLRPKTGMQNIQIAYPGHKFRKFTDNLHRKLLAIERCHNLLQSFARIGFD